MKFASSESEALEIAEVMRLMKLNRKDALLLIEIEPVDPDDPHRFTGVCRSLPDNTANPTIA